MVENWRLQTGDSFRKRRTEVSLQKATAERPPYKYYWNDDVLLRVRSYNPWDFPLLMLDEWISTFWDCIDIKSNTNLRTGFIYYLLGFSDIADESRSATLEVLLYTVKARSLRLGPRSNSVLFMGSVLALIEEQWISVTLMCRALPPASGPGVRSDI